MNYRKLSTLWALLLTAAMVLACAAKPDGVTIANKSIQLRFDRALHSQVIAFSGPAVTLTEMSASEYPVVNGAAVTDFLAETHNVHPVKDALGEGKQHILIGQAPGLSKQVSVTLYNDWPDVAVLQVTYTNTGAVPLTLDSWTNHHYTIPAGPAAAGKAPFWSYEPATYESRPDWFLPINPGFRQENYLGMNASDYGGGTPVADLWRPDAGIGIGHLETSPKLVALPIAMPDSLKAELSIRYAVNRQLQPGESLATLRTFVMVHRGDCFHTLATYRAMMIRSGIPANRYPATSYEPQWCAWGYERKFTMDQVVNTLPKAKELGFQWAVLDDGWQTAEGDWYLTKDKFPRGDADMINFVDRIKAGGLKPQLWWCPLAVDPGTDLIKNHPEYLLLNKDGSKQDISWWDSYYLCPAYAPVVEFTRSQVVQIMQKWGYQGLKIDGQHLNAVPPCYNPAHHHAYPEESCEKLPDFFKMIYETALSIYPEAVVEICPCGTSYSFFTMPYMNQSVASDPTSSWQTRLKGKTLKALMGADAAYYGDHVELTDGGDDFASQVGIGAVIGTKFTWPEGAARRPRYDLTPAREQEWKKWTAIYLEQMLPKGTYRGELYDLGYDRPEAHAIAREGRMYYAFYADAYAGEVELRGLEAKSYQVKDYVDGTSYGRVTGPTARIKVDLKKHLLLMATPE
ncbi:MAG TPA: alpha-galactosidase [bacterium]|nr:alpha-galactosidase [bacterium]